MLQICWAQPVRESSRGGAPVYQPEWCLGDGELLEEQEVCMHGSGVGGHGHNWTGERLILLLCGRLKIRTLGDGF